MMQPKADRACSSRVLLVSVSVVLKEGDTSPVESDQHIQHWKCEWSCKEVVLHLQEPMDKHIQPAAIAGWSKVGKSRYKQYQGFR